MHWWQGAFTSKSQSDEDDDGDVTAAIRYCLKPSFFSSRRNRLLSRARKLRQVTKTDVDMWRSPSQLQNTSSSSARSSATSASVASPQPLPVPELHVLLQRDPKFASSSSSCSMPLPSPGAVTKALEEKVRETRDEVSTVDAIDRYGHKRLVGHDSRTNAELSETRSSRKSSQKQNSRNNSSNRYTINIPISCPTSPYSSPAVSPPTSDLWATKYMSPPGVFQVWSAPEMPHSDANPGLDFYYQPHHKRTASSVDNSPLQSPRLSSHFVGTSPPRPASPINSIVSTDIPVARWESNAQATVHPLPLPPGAVVSSQPGPMSPVGPKSDCSSHPASIASHPAKTEYPGANTPPQPSPISTVGNKLEVMPIKSQWQKGKLIGRGTFGSVYVASNRETGALCAMKEVDSLPDDSKSAESMRQLAQEIKVLSRLKHPNIVQYYGSETVGDKFFIYLEYVHPGSINKFIHDHCGAITESVVRNFTRHILCGLVYLHSKKTIHRDIKGANLLVDAYGVVKLADFGMAKHLSSQAGQLSLKGSPYWMAPELLQSVTQMDGSSDLALAVDIWSLGCTIIEMMNGNPPWSEYEGAAALFKVLKETPPIPETLSPEGKDFLQCCFRRNPADRPTASKLLDHPFLSHSQQRDASTHGIKDLRSSDNMQFLRERPSHKKDRVPAPFDIQIKKLGNNEINQRSRVQTPLLAVGSLPSPRSILEPLPILSPPSSRNAPSGRQDADS